ncbi:MAG: Ig domain-containing protein, partial [Pirellula sp.]
MIQRDSAEFIMAATSQGRDAVLLHHSQKIHLHVAWMAILGAMVVASVSQLVHAVAPVSTNIAADASGTSLRFDRPEFTLRGRDARYQLLVSTGQDNGPMRDLTREARFECTPTGIVSIDSQGLVSPLAAGSVTIAARVEGQPTATTTVHVQVGDGDDIVNFPNQIVPIFTKYGCNGGGCHGKIAGQNGFRLSLLGFEPREDYEHLVRESRGRRLFPALPDSSLLLQKSVGTVPHGGGQRMEMDSHEYRLMRRWIAQAMPYGNANDRSITSIAVTPSSRQMNRSTDQQLSVVATYSDG